MRSEVEGEWCARETAALLERLQADVCGQLQALEQQRKKEVRMTRILSLALAVALSLVLALLADRAQAQTCNVASAPSAGYACSPSPIGPGSSVTIRSNAAGVVAWWYCPASVSGSAGLQFGAVTLAAMGDAVKALSYQAVAALTMPNPDLAFRTAIAANITTPIDDPSLMAVWCPHWAEMLAGVPVVAPPPPAVAYVVAKNGTSTTRPVYKLVAGKLSSTTLRAPVGAACSAIVTVGSSTYGTYVGAPAPEDVAICARAP